MVELGGNGPRSAKARRFVVLVRGGTAIATAARDCGVTRATADVWRLRWIENPALKAEVRELKRRLAVITQLPAEIITIDSDHARLV